MTSESKDDLYKIMHEPIDIPRLSSDEIEIRCSNIMAALPTVEEPNVYRSLIVPILIAASVCMIVSITMYMKMNNAFDYLTLYNGYFFTLDAN